MRRNARDRRRIGAFLGVSALVHLHIILLIVAGLTLNPDGCRAPEPDLGPIEVALVPAKSKADEVKKKIEEEDKKEEKKEKDDKGQVVELPPPIEEKRPDKARFRSEYDSKVARETKSSVPFKPGKIVAARPMPQRPRTRRAPPPTPRERQKIERKAMKLAMRTKPDVPKSDLKPSEKGDQAPKQKKEKAPKGPDVKAAQSASPKRNVKMRDLKLTASELARAVGTPVNDALKDVKEGKSTLLNSKRWRFASFFNRVKRQVAQNWHPDRAYKRRDPSGNVYGFRDRLTILRVQLTPKGKLMKLHIEKACGVGFLDDEAIAAFRAAEPFPNPPPGLVDKKTGMISFRFGFLFEISRRPNFRIFRYRN
ncbi:MAG: TonB family protein [Myxococcales bacterium]|nr:TonB family protein [Myxococcales bacterium]